MTLDDRYKVVSFYPTVYSTEYDRNFNQAAEATYIKDNVEVPQGILKNTEEKNKTVFLKDKSLKHSVASDVSKKKRHYNHHHHHCHKHRVKPSTNKSAHSSLYKNFDFSSEKLKRNEVFLSAAGIPSSEFSHSPFIQKKKVVAHQGDCLLLGDNNAFDGYLKQDDDLHRYKRSNIMDDSVYQPEPCLQRKKITLYKKNHNILYTYTTKEFNDSVVLPVFSNDALAEPSFQSRRKYFENNYRSEKDGRHHVSKTCLDLEDTKDLSTFKTKQTIYKYHAHKLKCSADHYLTSYSRDYSSMLRELSPTIAADLALQANRKLRDYQTNARRSISENTIITAKENEHSNIADDKKRAKSAEVNKKRTKSSEVNKKCTESAEDNEKLTKPAENDEKYTKSGGISDRSYVAGNYDDLFIDYYNRILEDRFFAYHPMILENMKKERENVATNIREHSRARDQHSDEKVDSSLKIRDLTLRNKETGSNESDRSSQNRTLFHKKPADSVCSTSSYDSRYSMSYNPSLYSDLT